MYERAPPSLAAGFKTFSAERSAIWTACFGVDGAPEAARRTRLKNAAPLIVFDKCCWHPEMRHRANATALAQKHLAKLGLADRDGMLQHRLEHRLELAGRAANDTEDLGCRSLLLQRLSSLPPCLGKLPPCLVSVTLCFRKLAGPGVQLLLQSFD